MGIVITGLICFFLFIFLFICGLIFFMQHRNRKSLIDKRLATILTPSGDRIDKLLKVNFNELRDKDPVTKEEIPYYVRPDKSFKVWWPFNRPKILQVNINSYLYAERNPEPLDPFWRPPVVDGLLMGNLKNINFSRAMVGRSEEIVAEQQAFSGMPKKKALPKGWLIIGGIVLIAIIIGAIMIMRSQGAATP